MSQKNMLIMDFSDIAATEYQRPILSLAALGRKP